MKRTKVILTVDTEPSIAGALKDPDRYPPLLDGPVWGRVDGRSEALGFITDTLVDRELRATFFVETVHTCHFGAEAMRPAARHLADTGQDVQLHIHPVWLNFRDDIQSPAKGGFNDSCASLDEALLRQLIREGCEQIESWTGTRPVALRTGNFSANRALYRVVSDANIQLASNICIGCEQYADIELNQSGGAHWLEDVCEIPTTCFRTPFATGASAYRPLQVTACSTGELITTLNAAHAQSTATIVITTHPFEFIKKADFRYRGLRPNRLVQGRMQAVCDFLAANVDRFEVTTFGDLARNGPGEAEPAPSLSGGALRSALRTLENVVNDRL